MELEPSQEMNLVMEDKKTGAKIEVFGKTISDEHWVLVKSEHKRLKEEAHGYAHRATLFFCFGKDFIQGIPETQRTIPNGQPGGGGETPGFQLEQYLPPAL